MLKYRQMKINKVKLAQDITRWFIAAIYIISGISKSLDSLSFAQLLKSYGLSRIQWGAPFIAFTEVLLGLLLLLNYRKQIISGVIGIMTIGFSLAFAYAYHFRGITDCGCMGFLTQTPPYLSFLRNLLIIIGCFWIWRSSASQDNQWTQWKQWTLIIISFATFGLSTYTYGKSVLPSYLLSEGDPIEKSFLVNYKHFYQNQPYSFIFVFSPDCTHCWNSTANISTIQQAPELGNVLGVTFDVTDTTEFMQSLKPQFPVVLGSTDSIVTDIKKIPVLIVIKDGKINRIFAKEIPCAATLKKMLEDK